MGAFYVDPYAAIHWTSYTRRLATNPLVLRGAGFLRNAVARALNGDEGDEVVEWDPVWAVAGQQRVVVWNGGPSDGP